MVRDMDEHHQFSDKKKIGKKTDDSKHAIALLCVRIRPYRCYELSLFNIQYKNAHYSARIFLSVRSEFQSMKINIVLLLAV